MIIYFNGYETLVVVALHRPYQIGTRVCALYLQSPNYFMIMVPEWSIVVRPYCLAEHWKVIGWRRPRSCAASQVRRVARRNFSLPLINSDVVGRRRARTVIKVPSREKGKLDSVFSLEWSATRRRWKSGRDSVGRESAREGREDDGVEGHPRQFEVARRVFQRVPKRTTALKISQHRLLLSGREEERFLLANVCFCRDSWIAVALCPTSQLLSLKEKPRWATRRTRFVLVARFSLDVKVPRSSGQTQRKTSGTFRLAVQRN